MISFGFLKNVRKSVEFYYFFSENRLFKNSSGTKNSQGNPKQKEQSWKQHATRLQTTLQGYSKQQHGTGTKTNT